MVSRFTNLLTLCLTLSVHLTQILAFPSYASLAGLSDEELARIIPTLQARDAPAPPGPLNDTSTKLINDKAHPWKPLKNGDIRGPCPGLNTLASHGYLPRNGIATPSQIINAVQEGFNMGNDLAVFTTYAAHLVDGNLVTDLLSIGGKTRKTGPNPPAPAIVGGLNTHAVFEGAPILPCSGTSLVAPTGDASMTRADTFFGDNHSFNETLFNEFVDFSNRFGNGSYNPTVAAEYRWQRIQDSIATNPEFSLISPRYFTVYAESVFPYAFFVDGRVGNQQVDMTTARGFFQNSQFPDGWFRPNGSVGFNEVGNGIAQLFQPHPIQPGRNVGGVNNYVVDPTSADFTQFCKLYTDFVNVTIRGLYPNPKGALLKALNTNLENFYSPLKGSDCPQFFPYAN